MNIFKPTTFTWEQLGLFKWGIFLIGIAAGAMWPNVFSKYVWVLFILGLILCVSPTITWLKEH